MKIINMTVDEVVANALDMAKKGPYIGINIADKPGVVYGNPDLVDLAAVDELKLPKLFVGYGGGAIVFNTGDFHIIALMEGMNDLAQRCLDALYDMCIERGLKNVEKRKNDLVVMDGGVPNKIVGVGSVWFGENTLHLIQVSLTINQELIDKVCKKTRVKIPTGLKDYLDIDAEDVLNYLKAHIDELK